MAIRKEKPVSDIPELNGYSTEEQLQEVKKAIRSVLVGGQSYKIGSRSLNRADLTILRQMENDLTAQIAAQSNGSLFPDTFVAVFDGR